MKSILSLLFLVSGLMSNAQCPFDQQDAGIDGEFANFRIEKFLTAKRPVLADVNERNAIVFSAKAFSALLKVVNEKKSDGSLVYDGLRAYFAINIDTTNVSDPEYNKMTLIFVPTSSYHNDDITRCFLLKENVDDLKELPTGQASDWIKAFQTSSKYSRLTSQGQITGGRTFEETKSLWYQQSSLSDDKGLLCFLNHRIPQIEKVILHFAAFGDGDPDLPRLPYSNHLTVVFGLMPTGKDEEIRFTFTGKRKGFVKRKTEPSDLFKLTVKSEYVDTGIPCPPPPQPSGTCPGALLPQN